MSKEAAVICEWEIWEDSTIGSDHYPVLCKIYVGIDERVEEERLNGYLLKLSGEKIEYLCEVESSEIDLNQDIDKIDDNLEK